MLLISFILLIASVPFAMAVPGLMKASHVRRQNRLLERRRVLFVLAVEAIGLGDEATARAYLRRIKRIESRWHFGNSWFYRFAFAFWAIGVGAFGYLMLRALGFFLVDARGPTAAALARLIEMLPFFLALGALGSLHGLVSYFTAWTDWRLVDDCGDRLERVLKTGRHVTVVSEDAAWRRFADGLTPEQIFGLGLTFTRRQLDRARRSLVAKLHPDRWHNAAPSVRRAREEALKRVNAAYDRLRPLAT